MDEHADLSLPWVYMLESMFSHVKAHFLVYKGP